MFIVPAILTIKEFISKLPRVNLFCLLFCITLISAKIFPQGYICAVGGGSEDYADWSDAPYSWIVQKADSGKIIILGTSSASSWLPNYFLSFGAASAVNMTINSRTLADAQSTYDELKTAKAIFIRGGDQWNYINYWKGTKTETAIMEIFQAGGVVAGTSAGLAVLGSVDFSARYGSVYPDNVLQNPFAASIDLESNFLNLVPGTLFDSHFIERGRSGRLIGMLLKAKVQLGLDILGVGVDDHTAICIDTNGIGTVMGSGAVAFFYADEQTHYDVNGSSYIMKGLRSHQLTNEWTFSFPSRQILSYPPSARIFIPGSDSIYTGGDISFTGSNNTAQWDTSHIARYLASAPHGTKALLMQANNSGNVQIIKNQLTAKGIPLHEIYINAASLASLSADALLQEATGIIIAADSLLPLEQLQDTSYPLAKTFISKTRQARVPVLFAGKPASAMSGRYVYIPDNDIYASWRGRMVLRNGFSLSGNIHVQPQTLDEDDYYENRVSALLWGMMRARKNFGIYLSNNDMLSIRLEGKQLYGWGKFPWFMVSARETNSIDSSVYRASGSAGPRQVVAMDNLRYFVSNRSDLIFSIPSQSFSSLTDIGEESYSPASPEYYIHPAYPNPFNPSVSISGKAPGGIPVTYEVYTVLGEMVASDILPPSHDGAFRFTVHFSEYSAPAGIYFCRVSAGSLISTQKLMLLK